MRNVRSLALHYVQMVVVMLVGMMLLWPLWMLATAGADDGTAVRAVEAESLAMATMMALPMAAWMRFRGHGWTSTLEMSTAMYVGFLATFPFLWAGELDADGVMMVGHVSMLALMLVAMVRRREEYADGCHADARGAEPAGTTLTSS